MRPDSDDNATATGSLVITMVNESNQKSECFIGSANVNTMKVTVKNTGTGTVTFGCGSNLVITPPNEGAPNQVFTAAQLQAVVVSASGWKVSKIDPTARFANWTLTPDQTTGNIDIDAGQSIDMSLSVVAITNDKINMQSYPWSFAWHNASNVNNGVIPLKTLFLIPQHGLLDFSVLPEFLHQSKIEIGSSSGYQSVYDIFPLRSGKNLVYATITPSGGGVVSQLKTQLMFSVANNMGKRVTFDSKTAFVFSFVECANGDSSIGALAQTKNIQDIKFEVFDTSTQTWKSLHQDIQGIQVFWSWNPGSLVFGTGGSAVVQFRISNIYTTLAPYLTPLYMVYSNIPNYKNGQITLAVEKIEPTPVVVNFHPTTIKAGPAPSSNPLDIGLAQQCILNWQTIAITEVAIDPNGHASVPGQPINGNFNGYVPYSTPTDLASLVTLDTTPTTTTQNSLQFLIKPVKINHFSGNGKSDDITALPDSKVTLEWDTAYASVVTLTDSANTVLVSYQYNADPGKTTKGNFVYTTPSDGQTETLTLTATGYDTATGKQGSVTSAVTIKPDLPFSVTYIKDKGPNGTIEAQWDLTKYTWDSASFEIIIELDGVPVCDNKGKQFKRDPKTEKGSYDYEIPNDSGTLPAGKYKVKVKLFLYVADKVTHTFLYSVEWTTKAKTSIVSDLKLVAH